MLYELTKSLEYLILSTENLKLKTVLRQVLQFTRIVKANIEIEYRVSYTIVFFLV